MCSCRRLQKMVKKSSERQGETLLANIKKMQKLCLLRQWQLHSNVRPGPSADKSSLGNRTADNRAVVNGGSLCPQSIYCTIGRNNTFR